MTEKYPEGGLNHLASGVYTVTKTFCTQMDCINRTSCHDKEGVNAEIGLLEKDIGCYMICHEYQFALSDKEQDKKVFWARKSI